MPIILSIIGIKEFNKNDSIITKYLGRDRFRKYTYSESIFLNEPYYAALNDYEYKFFFTTKEVCQEEERVNIDGYSAKLIEESTGNDKTNEDLEKVKKFTNLVLDPIKEYINY